MLGEVLFKRNESGLHTIGLLLNSSIFKIELSEEELLAELKEDTEIEVNKVSTFLAARQIAKRKADAKAAKANKG